MDRSVHFLNLTITNVSKPISPPNIEISQRVLNYRNREGKGFFKANRCGSVANINNDLLNKSIRTRSPPLRNRAVVAQ